MAKQAKQLVIQTRYVYNTEIRICPHYGAWLQPQAYYQWRKNVQQLTGAVYVAHMVSSLPERGERETGFMNMDKSVFIAIFLLQSIKN
jgi:hypothetical protein